MKNNLLTSAILTVFIAGSANAIELSNDKTTQLNLYGRIHVLDTINSETAAKDNASVRLGLKAQSKITESTSAYGRFEWEASMLDSFIDIDGRYDIDSRYAFAGFNFGDLGAIDYGKNDGVAREIAYYTDLLHDFNGDSVNYNILGRRTTNVLTYSNSDFFGMIDGFDFALQYADTHSVKFKDDSTNLTVAHEAYGLNGQYLILNSGVKIGGAYTKAGNDDTYIGGFSYNVDNVYLSMILDRTTVNSIIYTGYEAVIAYAADFELGHLTSSLAYISHETETTSKIKYFDFAEQYDLNKSISILLDYQFNLLHKNNDKIILGLIYYL